MNREARNQLLNAYQELYAAWRRGGDPARGLTADDAKAEFESRRLDYFDGLPVVPMSRCPYCGKILRGQFDPWGLDGFWWQERKLGAAREPEACGHFRLLTGALSLQDCPPNGGDYPAHPGPDVPYVVPEILEQDTAVAVIAALAMDNGYIAYPIAYYSAEEIAAASRSPTWRHTTCSFVALDGSPAWTPRVAPWDFDLTPWIDRGKLRWISPGDDEMQLQETGPCPYLDLPGKRRNQVVKQDRLRFVGPPTGDMPEPFSQ